MLGASKPDKVDSLIGNLWISKSLVDWLDRALNEQAIGSRRNHFSAGSVEVLRC